MNQTTNLNKKNDQTTLNQIKITVDTKYKHDLKVKGFFLDQWKEKPELKNKFIIKKIYSLSLLPEQKTLYVCLGDKKTWNHKILEKVIANIICGITDWDFDFLIETFIHNKVHQEDIFQNFIRKVYFCHLEKLDFKSINTKKEKLPAINIKLNEKTQDITIWKNKLKQNQIIMTAVNYCQHLQDTPPNILNSIKFAQKTSLLFQENKNVKCEILNKQEIEKEKMNLILAVNAGSQYEPRVVILKYLNNPQSKEKTVLIGKGITFDTGGYSLKPSQYQLGMKYDMSGAAAVVSAIKGISELNLKTNVIGIVALTDNCIGSTATLVESVIRSKSGKMVEITNTDAEGRLVVADAISYAKEKWSPEAIIELSTLTGAISVALSDSITGAFTNKEDEKLYQNFNVASKKVNEPIWLLPVTEENTQNMKSNIADLVNSSKTYKGGSSNAAAFLFEFAKETPFLHLDIAGTATKPENQRGTGIMVQSIIQFFQDNKILKK